jgi:hypothetical protein
MREPRSYLGRHQSPRLDLEAEKQAGWREHGILVVAQQAARLTRSERELIRQVGIRLCGQHRSATDG